MQLPDDELIVDTTAPDDAPPLRRIRLATTDEISVELARVYRDARGGRIKAEDATRFTYILHTLARIREADIEARLAQMERLLGAGGAGR